MFALFAVLVVFLAAACGDSNKPPATPDLPDEWTVIRPGGDTICSRGTEYAYAVRGGSVNKVVVEFMGGGACWSDLTCSVADAIFNAEVNVERLSEISGSGIYDRENEENPFKDWYHVFIPYCTGDIHWGNSVVEYGEGENAFTIHHKGAVNSQAVMDWVYENFERPENIFITGCSAGAYGSIGWAAYLMDHYKNSDIVQVGDCGAGVVTETFFQDSFPNWNASSMVPWWLPELEGKSIDDLYIIALYSAIVNGIPEMRVAQYNTAFDKDQIFYFDVMGGEAEDWHPKLVDTLAEITARAPAFRHYMAPGPVHCIHPYDFFYEREVNGVAYSAWLYELAHGEDPPDTVACEGISCLDDPICAACLDGTSGDPGCGWCNGWDPNMEP